ncbi:maleylpyruvate isomerase family mycothiol-dependent enzyme [Demetria terragena]|uniref:maleylpyruvate isomerase family mycothiol-dependent enzyme n=1 Tax=Demetria terragena TaxID=63959 RepID=UPI00037FEA7B|nr:maleylpyruvate isomerase family mycothiol-dependent enzyme [Demetria terragena]
MPTSVTFEAHLDALALATARIHAYGDAAGLDAAVPTCRGWSVQDLVAHQGMVHRWASNIVRELPRRATDAWEQEGRGVSDPMAWLGHGSDVLRAALMQAPPDLDVWFLLPNGPAPRDAWARRQCHETTMHAVDALSAQLGRVPLAREADLPADIAADGVDEMLTGFAARPSVELRSPEPLTAEVRAHDTGDVWRIQISDQPLIVERTTTAGAAASVVYGTAAQLYLGLWNRGNEMSSEGHDLVPLWRNRVKVSWS